MKELYFFCDIFESLETDSYGDGFISYPIEKADADYYYYNDRYRVSKKTHIIEHKWILTGEYDKFHHQMKFYPSKELWEKARTDYLKKLLSDNEADKIKILKSMEK